MKRLVLFLVPALMLVFTAGAFAQATPQAGESPSVFVRQDPSLGPILTDSKGMTLYLYTKDTTPGESTCYDKCATNWPPFMASEPLSLPGNVEGTLSTITRTDGTTQVAYNDIPLYYFAKDTQPGDTMGEGVGDVWYVVHPGAKFGAEATPMASPSAQPVGSPMASNEVAVTLTEFTLEASQTEFKVGQTYTFNVSNQGEFTHEMVIEKSGANDEPMEASGVESEVQPIDAGQSGTVTWTFTEAGTYQIACHVRSHYPMGMALTIHVTA
jgi:predicted lipoprotein with Yx(FWY)xxD motif/uncharacterized cupredoxin-like copper-binding protein